MENKLTDFESFKLENKLKSNNELLKMSHQWLLLSLFMKKRLNQLIDDNSCLNGLNEAFLDIFEKHGIDILTQLPHDVLKNYIESRKKQISLNNNPLTKEAMELNAFLAAGDALSQNGKKGGDKKNEKTNLAKEQIVKVWKSGKYSSRDICAEQEAAVFGISFSTARKALRNIPKNT